MENKHEKVKRGPSVGRKAKHIAQEEESEETSSVSHCEVAMASERSLVREKAKVYSAPYNEEEDRKMPAMGSDSVKELYEILNGVPARMKEAYVEAESKAPDLCAKEAKPLSFLQVENFDGDAAGVRLTAYWSHKKEMFGERFHLPVDQTGEGAMERKDLGVLATGFAALLPKDDFGRAAVFIDLSRLKEGSLKANVEHCIYYIHLVASETPSAQTDGIVLLFSLERAVVSIEEILGLIHRLSKTMPIRYHTVHFISSQKPAPFRPRIEFCKCVYLHEGHDREAIANTLTEYGFRKEDLPFKFGGKWSYEKFVQWQELRTRLEWNIPLGLSGRSVLGDFVAPLLLPLHALSEEDQVERKRRLNVVHSRRKRDRERIETEVLSEQHSELSETHEKLTAENKRLKKLKDEADAIVRVLKDKVKNKGSVQVHQRPTSATTPAPAGMESGETTRRDVAPTHSRGRSQAEQSQHNPLLQGNSVAGTGRQSVIRMGQGFGQIRPHSFHQQIFQQQMLQQQMFQSQNFQQQLQPLQTGSFPGIFGIPGIVTLQPIINVVVRPPAVAGQSSSFEDTDSNFASMQAQNLMRQQAQGVSFLPQFQQQNSMNMPRLQPASQRMAAANAMQHRDHANQEAKASDDSRDVPDRIISERNEGDEEDNDNTYVHNDGDESSEQNEVQNEEAESDSRHSSGSSAVVQNILQQLGRPR